jgi:hypothetical protein
MRHRSGYSLELDVARCWRTILVYNLERVGFTEDYASNLEDDHPLLWLLAYDSLYGSAAHRRQSGRLDGVFVGFIGLTVND